LGDDLSYSAISACSLSGIFATEHDWLKMIGMYHLYLIFGFVFSLPSLLTYYLLFQLLENMPLSLLMKKLLLIGFSVLSIAVTCWLIKGSMMPILGTAYSVAAIISGFQFTLRKDNAALPTTSSL
jgi:hypothetical protein